MNREEFIGKLQACYFGDRNAFNEIVSVYDELNTRIDKVVKYIEKNRMMIEDIEVMSDSEYILEILKGKNE